ncbi:MAG: DNA/RNA non-specific endonuclease [Clostridiales bacterium]|nr:DNA/RNA non-specific endonuclease [Clostridiales bacterium]
MRKYKHMLLPFLLMGMLLLSGCGATSNQQESVTGRVSNLGQSVSEYVLDSTDSGEEAADDASGTASAVSFDLSDIPEYTGSPYVVIDDNVPDFDEEDMTTDSFETYAELDSLGRCGVAYACIGTDLMPTEARGSISEVKPTGWHSVQYDIVEGKSLYNRCHLIGYQLTAENANKNNLITGTRYLNVDGMLPFENMVADYIEETDYHVLYRVTPVFDDDNLVASGVQMEAMSVEDEGEEILFNVYCYNVQPGIVIDYATGGSWEDDEYSAADAESGENADEDSGEVMTYILNTSPSSMKFHLPTCSSVDKMSEANKKEVTTDRQTLIDEGYSPCGNCNP